MSTFNRPLVCFFDKFMEVGMEGNTTDSVWNKVAQGGFLVPQRASVTRMN